MYDERQGRIVLRDVGGTENKQTKRLHFKMEHNEDFSWNSCVYKKTFIPFAFIFTFFVVVVESWNIEWIFTLFFWYRFLSSSADNALCSNDLSPDGEKLLAKLSPILLWFVNTLYVQLSLVYRCAYSNLWEINLQTVRTGFKVKVKFILVQTLLLSLRIHRAEESLRLMIFNNLTSAIRQPGTKISKVDSMVNPYLGSWA